MVKVNQTVSIPGATSLKVIGVKSAMAKKRAPKRRAWNKGLEVGKRDGFTPDQVKRISEPYRGSWRPRAQRFGSLLDGN